MIQGYWKKSVHFAEFSIVKKMVAEKRKSVGNVEHPPTLLGGTAIKPPERHGFDIIKYVIWDGEKGEVFTRTPKSWFLITLFYCIYYSCLAAFWYGMLQIFFIFLPDDQPKYILSSSIIGTNPGVGMQPKQPSITIDSSMLFLQWNAENEEPSSDWETESNIDWAKRYESFLDIYKNKTQTRVCGDDDGGQDNMGKDACQYDVSALGPCGTFPYGFQLEAGKKQIEPCILLKINRIFGWEPEEYTDDDLNEDEEESENPIPENVKTLIRANRRKLYLDCQGENPADREILDGKLKYYPEDQGISYKYFPYNHAHKNYQNALVAVKFVDVPLFRLMHIECKLWTKGITHSRKNRIGQVHLELMLDNYPKKDEE